MHLKTKNTKTLCYRRDITQYNLALERHVVVVVLRAKKFPTLNNREAALTESLLQMKN